MGIVGPSSATSWQRAQRQAQQETQPGGTYESYSEIEKKKKDHPPRLPMFQPFKPHLLKLNR